MAARQRKATSSWVRGSLPVGLQPTAGQDRGGAATACYAAGALPGGPLRIVPRPATARSIGQPPELRERPEVRRRGPGHGPEGTVVSGTRAVIGLSAERRGLSQA